MKIVLGLCLLATWSELALAQQTDTMARRTRAPDSARVQRKLDSLAIIVRALEARLDSAQQNKDTAAAGDELAAIRAAAAAAGGGGDSTTAPPAQQQPRLGQNALNPEISVTGDVRGYLRSPGPATDNFVAREFEVGMQSALDPFSTAKVIVSFSEEGADVEEGYAFFTSLPAHTRLDVGKFRQQVGELNRWHLHALPEDEYPLVIRRFAGDEGLAAPGVSLYWPLPLAAFGGAYELTVQGTTGENDVLFAGGRRPSVNAQVAGFWQTSRATYAQLSFSGLYGTNPDTSLTTKLGVAAARFSWRPPQQAQARELTLRGELWALNRRFALPAPDAFDATRLGGYVDGTWKLNRRWTVSARGDYVQSPEPVIDAHEWAITPTLTFWQSEFVFMRAAYEHARDLFDTNRDRFTIQVVFAMGPHKHELF
ncbi:MAG TPA: hypothetical protein VKH19_10520 [Gemmatimonadaceae bacterium]|nr:hypothetical protein [Gemmatimonadaceae bacterium]